MKTDAPASLQNFHVWATQDYPAKLEHESIRAKTDEPGEAKGESTLAETGHIKVPRAMPVGLHFLIARFYGP